MSTNNLPETVQEDNRSYEALFISEQRFKSYTAVDENVRLEDITNFILKAQAIYIQPILGTSFYNKFKNYVKNGGLYTENCDMYNLLNDYIAPALIEYSLYMMLPFIKYKIRAKGVLNGASEETESTDLSELKYLQQHVLNTAEFFAARLVKELKDYPGRFPEYQAPGTKGMKPDKSSPYFSGLMTNRGRGCNIIEGKSSYSMVNKNNC